jgi:hypothetical protein
MQGHKFIKTTEYEIYATLVRTYPFFPFSSNEIISLQGLCPAHPLANAFSQLDFPFPTQSPSRSEYISINQLQ